MYAGDSFFTLTGPERLGLLVLSGVLALAVVAVAVWLMRGRRGSVRLAIAAMAFVLFVWLSPQVYYAYYRLVIDGLPGQWVVGAPPTLLELVELIRFGGPPRLSDHGQGVLFWVLVIAALWPRPAKAARDPAP